MRQTESVVIERPLEDSRSSMATPRVGSLPHLTLDAVARRGDPPTHARAFSRRQRRGGVLGNGGNKELPSARDEGHGEASILINQGDVHIFGMSETTRRELARGNPKLQNLQLPVALRGNPRTGGLVAIGRNEAGGIVDAGSDTEGKQWLIEVGRLITRDTTLSDPGAGAEAVFHEHLSQARIEADIVGP